MGDPGGIGPEIILKALPVFRRQRFHLFASTRLLRHHAESLGIPFDSAKYPITDIDNVAEPYFGPRPEIAGKASIEYLDREFEFYKEGKIDAIVTAPIQKESWHRAGFHYPGQTEYCAERTGTTEFCMLMAGKKFRIALISTHLSLSSALQLVRKETILEKIRLL